MRKKLGKKNKERLKFIAKIERFGTKPNYHGFPEMTILFTDVRFDNSQEPATDHIWLTVGKTIDRLNLRESDVVRFEARVGTYVKGFVNRRQMIDERVVDFKLNRPTKMEKIQVI